MADFSEFLSVVCRPAFLQNGNDDRLFEHPIG
jgi:hypothetical protein